MYSAPDNYSTRILVRLLLAPTGPLSDVEHGLSLGCANARHPPYLGPWPASGSRATPADPTLGTQKRGTLESDLGRTASLTEEPPDTLPRGAVAAVENADRLRGESLLLFEHACWASSLALAAIGVEEIGKALLFGLAHLDRPPGIRQKVYGLVRNHPLKHSVAQMADVLVFLLDEERELRAEPIDVAPTPDADGGVEAFVSRCAGWIVTERLLEKAGAAAFLKRRARFQAESHIDRAGRFPMLRMTPEERRMAALYVDVHDDRVWSPEAVNQTDANLALGDLIGYLEVAAPLVAGMVKLNS